MKRSKESSHRNVTAETQRITDATSETSDYENRTLPVSDDQIELRILFKNDIIIIDGTRGTGRDPRPTDEFFAMASTETNEPESFAKISKEVDERIRDLPDYRGEVKYSQHKEEVDDSTYKASKLNIKTHGVYIIKGSEDVPPWWNKEGARGKKRVNAHLGVLETLLDETFSNAERVRYKVVIDSHDDYKDGIVEALIAEKAKEYGKEVSVTIEDSKTGRNKYLLQSHDVITYVLGDYV